METPKGVRGRSGLGPRCIQSEEAADDFGDSDRPILFQVAIGSPQKCHVGIILVELDVQVFFHLQT